MERTLNRWPWVFEDAQESWFEKEKAEFLLTRSVTREGVLVSWSLRRITMRPITRKDEECDVLEPNIRENMPWEPLVKRDGETATLDVL